MASTFVPIHNLPNEILWEIYQSIAVSVDSAERNEVLRGLSLTSKNLQSFAQALLYRHVIIEDRVTLMRFVRTLVENRDLAMEISHLSIKLPAIHRSYRDNEPKGGFPYECVSGFDASMVFHAAKEHRDANNMLRRLCSRPRLIEESLVVSLGTALASNVRILTLTFNHEIDLFVSDTVYEHLQRIDFGGSLFCKPPYRHLLKTTTSLMARAPNVHSLRLTITRSIFHKLESSANQKLVRSSFQNLFFQTRNLEALCLKLYGFDDDEFINNMKQIREDLPTSRGKVWKYIDCRIMHPLDLPVDPVHQHKIQLRQDGSVQFKHNLAYHTTSTFRIVHDPQDQFALYLRVPITQAIPADWVDRAMQDVPDYVLPPKLVLAGRRADYRLMRALKKAFGSGTSKVRILYID